MWAVDFYSDDGGKVRSRCESACTVMKTEEKLAEAECQDVMNRLWNLLHKQYGTYETRQELLEITMRELKKTFDLGELVRQTDEVIQQYYAMYINNYALT